MEVSFLIHIFDPNQLKQTYMAKIFNPPSSVVMPKVDYSNMANYHKDQDTYLEQLKEVLQKRKNGKNVGEIINFPVADGYASYMIASMKPLELVHIPLGDAWHFDYANRLTANDVQDKLDQEKAMNRLFSKKK